MEFTIKQIYGTWKMKDEKSRVSIYISYLQSTGFPKANGEFVKEIIKEVFIIIVKHLSIY